MATTKIENEAARSDKEERLLQALLPLFTAGPVMQVIQQYNTENRTDFKCVPSEIRYDKDSIVLTEKEEVCEHVFTRKRYLPTLSLNSIYARKIKISTMQISPLLSSWDKALKTIHEGDQLDKSLFQKGNRKDLQPRTEQTAIDKWLDD